jgi:hypothetical protein
MMRSDASSRLRHNGEDTKTGTTISIGLIAIALIVAGVLLAAAWVMLEALPIIADEYARFV